MRAYPQSFFPHDPGIIFLRLRAINNLIYRINSDKCLPVRFHQVTHQFAVLMLVHDSNDLPVWLEIICPDGLIDGRAAMQLLDDKLPDLFLLFGQNADPPLHFGAKNEMIQHH